VTGLTIDEPEMVLLQSDSGEWNFSSLGAKAPENTPPVAPAPPEKAGLDLSVKLVKITGGRVSIGNDNSRSKPLAIEKMNVELRDFSSTSVFPFSLTATVAGGGAIKLEGKAGPIPADTALTPIEASLNVSQLNLAASGLADASTGVAGLVSVDGSGASNGKTLEVKGKLKGEQLKLAKNGSPAKRAIEFDFAVEHDLKKRSGVLSRGDIRIGAAPASLTGSYKQSSESTVLNMNLAGRDMPVPELAGMLPALGVVLPSGSSLEGGTAAAKLALAGAANQLVTTGTLGLNNTRLAGFDLGSKLSAIVKLAGIKADHDTEIQTFSATVRVTPEGTSAEDIQLIAPAIGELNGAGTVSALHALDFKMRAKLHTSGRVMAAIGQKGDSSVPFLVGGTSSNPIFRPDMKEITAEQIKGLKESSAGKRASGFLNGLFGRKRKK
jgi:AsmA protein